MHGPGLAAGHEPTGARVPAIREALGDDDQAVVGRDARQHPTRLGHHGDLVAERMGGTHDRVGHDLRGHAVVHGLVVQRAVRLDVGKGCTVPLGLPGHHEDLLDQVAHQVRTRRRVAAEDLEVGGPAESDPVPVGGVSAQCDPVPGTPPSRRAPAALPHRHAPLWPRSPR